LRGLLIARFKSIEMKLQSKALTKKIWNFYMNGKIIQVFRWQKICATPRNVIAPLPGINLIGFNG